MNEKVKNKKTRKTSIITVFLWIFLIATMSVIMLSGISRSKALEEENDKETRIVSEEPVIRKSVSPIENVRIGDEVTYKIEVENTTEKITNVVIEDNLSEQLDIISCELNGEEILDYNGSIKIPTMENGDIATLIIKAIPNGAGEIKNKATLTYDKDGTIKTIESDEVTINVFIKKLKITKSVSPSGDIMVGDKLTYTILVENPNNFDIPLIVLQDEISPKLELLSGGPLWITTLDNYCTWVGRIERNGTLKLVIPARAKEEGEVKNKVSLFYQVYNDKGPTETIVSNEVITNVIRKQDKIRILGKKIWEDNENVANKRNESVTLQLKVGDNVISEAEVNESNNWRYEFEAFKYDGFDGEIEYYIDEKENENIFYEKELTNATTVTNKFKVPDEKVIIKAEKIWEDEDNKYGERPESVVLQIKNKDEIVEEATVDNSNNWTYEFEVTKYDELGNEIEYTVDEKETSEFYEKTVDGYTVINKYKNISEDKKDEQNIDNKSDIENVDTSDINIHTYILIFTLSIVVMLFIIKDKLINENIDNK